MKNKTLFLFFTYVHIFFCFHPLIKKCVDRINSIKNPDIVTIIVDDWLKSIDTLRITNEIPFFNQGETHIHLSNKQDWNCMTKRETKPWYLFNN